MTLSIHIAAMTHTGLIRKRNEDSMSIGSLVFSGVAMDKPWTTTIETLPVFLAVADGIGGAIAGDIASREALQFLASSDVPKDEEGCRELIIAAGDQLNTIVAENPVLEGMGTTVCGVLITFGELFFFSCGDSRVYYTPDKIASLEPMTKDHSIIQEMIDAGTLTEKEARMHPLGHIITSCLSGGRVSKKPDVRITRMKQHTGSRIVVCTDGVWDYGSDAFLQAATKDDPEKTAIAIADICFHIGAPDNFTFIIADIK